MFKKQISYNSYLRTIVMALAFIMGSVCNIQAQSVGEYLTVDGLTYKVLSFTGDSGTLEVIGFATSDDILSIPSTVEFEGSIFQVTAIGDEAFKWSEFTAFDMSAAYSLQRIGASAFAECRQLENVIFPAVESSSLSEIGPLAFHHDFALKNINLEDTRLEVLESLFSKNERDEISIPGLKTLRLPSTLTEIKAYALQFLDITEIEIPSGVTTFANRVLEGCIYLKDVTWKDCQITSIPKQTFLGDDKLENVTILTVNPLDPDGLTDRHFFMCDKELLTVTVTQASYDNLAAGGYTNETSVYSTLAVWADDPSDIIGVSSSETNFKISADDAWYTLQGIRVSHPEPGQLYICRGRKCFYHP